MIPGAHDGPTTTDSDSDYEFEDFNPTSPLDHILVNRLKKQTRNSLEPVSREMAVAILKKGLPTKNQDKLEAMREQGEAFQELSSAGILFQNNIQDS